MKSPKASPAQPVDMPMHIRDLVTACLQSPDRMKLEKLVAAIEAAAKPSHTPSVTTGEHGRTTSVDHRGLVAVSAGDKGSTPSHEAKSVKNAAEIKIADELSQPKAYW